MDSRDIKDNQDDINDIEWIIGRGDDLDGVCTIDVQQAHYLEAIAKTQLLILKELRKRKECTCQKS